jgi:AraC-like DNA-binding protein
LQRLLKKEGQNFSELLQEVRFRRASDRLLYSNFTTAQIAQELGFNDAVAFFHAFKQWVGAAPRQWREQNKPAICE